MRIGRRLGWSALLAIAQLLPPAAGLQAPRAAAVDSLDAWTATSTLVRRLKAAGRAQATLERSVFDPMAGKRVAVRGELVLEPPDRASLYFPSTGERVTMRSDGGEWLQPQLQQMLRLGPDRAQAARRWWDVLLPERDRRVEARRIDRRRFVLVARFERDSPPDSAWIQLDAHGLPARLEIREDGDQKTLYRFERWRFSRAKGPAAFVLRAPDGYEVVELP